MTKIYISHFLNNTIVSDYFKLNIRYGFTINVTFSHFSLLMILKYILQTLP